MKKGFILGFICAIILAVGISFASEMLSDVYTSPFPIKINGKDYTAEMPVLNYQGRTYLALREFGTATGNTIDFIDNTIIINTKDYTLQNPSQNGREAIIYEDENYIFKIKDYNTNTSLLDGITLELFMENKSDTETTFTIESDPIIDGYTVDGGWMYKEVMAGSKANDSYEIYTYRNEDINLKKANSITFKYSIYQSKNYLTTKRIATDELFTYTFVK